MILLTVLSWAIVILAGIAVGRTVLKPPFRRDLAALPALRSRVVTAGVVAMIAAALVFAMVPVLLYAAAIASTAGMGYLWLRAQPSHGRRRGWPPGSLGINASIDAIDNRDYYLEQAALHGPVFKMSQFGRPVLCVVGLARGRRLIQDHRESLAGAALPYNRFVRHGLLRYQARSTHRTEGPLFRKAFASITLEPDEDLVRQACRDRLSAFANDAGDSRDGGDLRPFIRAWTVESLAGAFFGIRATAPQVSVLVDAQAALDLDRSGGRAWRTAMLDGLAKATALLSETARDLLARGDTASVLGAIVNAAPETAEDEGRLRNLFFMFRLGVGDLGAALAWVAYHVSTHPEWQPRVREAGRTAGSPRGALPQDLASRMVLETLRLEQSEFLYRRVVKPIDFEGFHIPAGWILRICIQESHRDPQVFPDPSKFHPDRFLGRSYSRSEYATFGLDEHGCLGSTMVHFFGRILVEELCAGYDILVTADTPLEHGTRHRHHWRPGRGWRIALQPVGAEALT